MDFSKLTKKELLKEVERLSLKATKYEIDFKNRIKAKEFLKKQSGGLIHHIDSNIDKSEISQLIEELNIHQIELEMQNDELIKTNDLIAREREQYHELYNEAPIPYLTLNKTADIIQINKAAAELLSIEQYKLKQTSLYPFIEPDSKFKLSLHLSNVIDGDETEFTEIEIIDNNGHKIFCQLQTISYFDNNLNEKLCRVTVTDISRQKAEIFRSREKFKIFFKSMKDAIFIHPLSDIPDQTFTEVNQVAIDKYGYTKEEFLQLTPFDITLNDSIDVDKAREIHKVITEKGKAVFEAIHLDKEQNQIPVEISTSVMDLDNRKYIMSVARDISERKAATERISQLNNRIESSMLAGNMAWWEMELPSGKVVFNNNKTKLLGYKENDFTHYMDFMKYVHPDDYESTMQAMKEHIGGKKKFYETEYRIKAKNGDYKWFYDIGRIVEKNNDIIKIAGIVIDVTDKKSAEIALDNERNQFLSILDNIPEEIYVADLNDFKIIFANKALKQNHPNFVMGKKCYEVLHNSETHCDICDNESLSENTPNYREYYNEINNRHYYVIERIIHWSNQQNLKFQMSIDITKRKEAEIKLEEINKTKDKLFSIIAHDLRSPFTGFIGLSDLLSQETDTITKEELKEISEAINKSANAIFGLINDLLLWARTQSDSVPINKEHLDVYELIYNNIYLLSKTAEIKNINLISSCNQHIIVECDRNMIMTVIRNLLDNAIKFSQKNSKIIIDCIEENHFVTISIKDFGKGISYKMMNSIFDIGTKTSTKGTAGEKGSGLGLIICKEFVEKNNGKIWVESEPGNGATFYFTLPLSE